MAFFLTLYSHGLLLTLLGFPGPITLSFILEVHGLPSTPYFLFLHYFRLVVARSHFSTSHTAHGFATSLSSGFFRSICFFKAHLSISWAYDPLFLPFELNGFFIHLLTLFYPCCWASSFYWASQNDHQHKYYIIGGNALLVPTFCTFSILVPTFYFYHF